MDEDTRKYKEHNPLMTDILSRDSAVSESDFKKFRDSNVQDVLLPFPLDGRGLPESFRRSGKEIKFLNNQGIVLAKVAPLKEAVQKGSLAHGHLDKDAAQELFYRVSNRNEDKELHLPPREECEQRRKGGFARVFAIRFKDGPNERLVLKWIPRPGTDGKDWEGNDRVGNSGPRNRYPDNQQLVFQRERQILAFLSEHRSPQQRLEDIRANHIIQLRASFTDPQAFCLVLFPVALCDLEELLYGFSNDRCSEWPRGEHRIKKELIRGWLHQYFGCIAAGLLFLHRLNIRHKDIKPKNLLVVFDGRNEGKICLCDFGMAQRMDNPDDKTRGKVIIQTPAYTTPERLYMNDRDLKDDMYLLGLVYLEIFTAIKGKTTKDLEQHVKNNHVSTPTNGVHIPILKQKCSPEQIKTWLDTLMSKPHAESDVVARWIEDLLKADPQDRPDSVSLVQKIKHADEDHLFWGNCCASFYNETSNLVESALSETCDENIVFRKSVANLTLLSPQEDLVIQEPSTIAVIDSFSLERRILIAKNGSWPFPESFEAYEWLPLTGIHITRMSPERIAMQWSDFNQRMCTKDDTNRFIDLMHTFPRIRHDSKVGLKEISLSSTHKIFLQTLEANTLKPPKPIAFFSVEESKNTVLTLYLLRAALPPLDIDLDGNTLRLSGLESIDYEGSERVQGCVPEEARGIQYRVLVQRPLEFKLLPAASSELLIANPRVEERSSCSLYARSGFFDFMEQLTNKEWEIRMLCCVSQVVQLIPGLSRAFGPALMILWKSDGTDETPPQQRVTLKVKDSSRGWQWLVGEVPNDAARLNMVAIHKTKTCQFELVHTHKTDKLHVRHPTTSPSNSKLLRLSITFNCLEAFELFERAARTDFRV